MINSKEIVYFAKPGKVNTEKTLTLALSRAKELNIKNIVIASTTGTTARRFSKMVPKGLNVVCVTHHAGFEQPGEVELKEETKEYLTKQGMTVYRGTHFFSGVGRAIRKKFGGLYEGEVVANTYRTLGEGFKVCVEISIMALDAGLIPYGKEIISIAGTDRGADTAIVILPNYGRSFFDTKILEIICMPRAD